MNRGAKRARLFESPEDYEAFLRCVDHALARVPIDIYAYCLMPNHLHMVLCPAGDGDVSRFMKVLLGIHSLRWQAHRGTLGQGAVYQGRFRAFAIQTERYFLRVCRYVEQNPVRAHLVETAEAWPWSSASSPRGTHRRLEMSPWPVEKPLNWTEILDAPETVTELQRVRTSTTSGRPLGDPTWSASMASALGLASTLGSRGRPRKPFG
jgi:putative transposase